MATPIHPLIISGSRKSDGTVNAGGRVFLTQVGSANIAVTGYADPDKLAALTLNGGGYLLDNAGKAAIYVDRPCTVRIEDSAGVAVDSYSFNPSTNAGLVEVVNAGFTGVNPVTGQSTAGARTYLDAVLSNLSSSLGGKDGKFRGIYGTADTYFKTEVEQIGLTPQRFGANGNGITDDTVAFQAMAAAQIASGIPVFLPKGAYIISQAIAFGNSAYVFGVSRSANSGSIIICTNAAQNGLTFLAGATLINFSVLTSSGSTGTGIITNLGGGGSTPGKLTGINVTNFAGGQFATAVNAAAGPNAASACVFNGSTNATLGSWIFDQGTSTTGGAVSSQTVYVPKVAASSGDLYVASTTDMASGGSVTPTIGAANQLISYHRIRGTTVGGGTVNSPGSGAYGGQELTLELVNTTAGAFLFTMNAIFKTSGNPNPGAGLRITVTFSWNISESLWVEKSRSAAL